MSEEESTDRNQLPNLKNRFLVFRHFYDINDSDGLFGVYLSTDSADEAHTFLEKTRSGPRDFMTYIYDQDKREIIGTVNVDDYLMRPESD